MMTLGIWRRFQNKTQSHTAAEGDATTTAAQHRAQALAPREKSPERSGKKKKKSEQGTIQSNSQMGFWMHKCIFVIGQTTTNALEPKEKMWEMYN